MRRGTLIAVSAGFVAICATGAAETAIKRLESPLRLGSQQQRRRDRDCSIRDQG
jgi:hypothetical protein